MALDTIDTDIEEVYISYCNPMKTRKERKASLDNYFFDCKCERCLNPVVDDMACLSYKELCDNLEKEAVKYDKDFKKVFELSLKSLQVLIGLLGKFSLIANIHRINIFNSLLLWMKMIGSKKLPYDTIKYHLNDMRSSCKIIYWREHVVNNNGV